MKVMRLGNGKLAIGLFIAAVVVRVSHCLLFANEIIPGSDQMQEINLGRELAAGNLYGVLDTYWAPLYPILIGILSTFTDSLLLPAALISVAASGLIVSLTYLLAEQTYGKRVGLIAGVISIFFPHYINAVIVVGSENLFIALIVGVLLVVWKALKADSTILFFCSGALLGLAYLTRPEAIGYSAFLAIVVILHNLRHKKPQLSATPRQVGAIFLGLFLFAAPYLFYLHSETGQWTISGKTKINTITGGFDADPESLEQYERNGAVKEFTKYFVANILEAQKTLPILFPLLLWCFVGLGLFSKRWDRLRFEREIFLIFFCLVTIAGYAAAVIQLRYFYVLLPVLIGWLAYGIVIFASWLRGAISVLLERESPVIGRRPLIGLIVAAVIIYALPLNFYMRPADRRWEYGGYEERDAGVWLRENSTGEPYVFSASRRPAFFADARQLGPVSENLDEVVASIKKERVDYVIAGERSIKRNPYLENLDEVLRNDTSFEVVYENTRHKGYKIVIFKQKDSPN